MLHIHTTDNNCGKNVSFSDEFNKNHFDSILRIANFPLSELCAKNDEILVFPPKVKDSFGKIDDEKIFEMTGNAEKLADIKIKTGNLMGFLGTGEGESEVQMQITSRFVQGSGENENDFFLHYMLCKVYAPNLVNFPTDFSLDGTFEILSLLFSYYLRRAMKQGIFKKYQTFEKNDANVRGAINIPRHIRQNIPFAEKVAYTERNRATDNFLTELVRHTIEAIKTTEIGKIILSQKETKDFVNQIVELTPAYNFFARGKIISKNLKTENHPFFTEWKNLQKLCLAILRHKKVSFAKSANHIHGLLFDGAWLWEEYLATILKPLGFTHPENKESKGGIKVFENSSSALRFFPDFYKSDFVLDAKYKNYGETCVQSSDYHQIISYMHILKSTRGGFVFPSKDCRVKPDNDTTRKSDNDIIHKSDNVKSYQLSGLGGTITLFGFPIPQNATNFSSFCEQIKSSEELLKSL